MSLEGVQAHSEATTLRSMQHRHRRRFALAAGIGLFGCGPSSNDGTAAARDDASGPIIVSPDASFRIPNFACDGSAPDHDPMDLPDAPPETGGCTVTNSTVRFKTDVLPVFEGCSGELCHGPWSYRTTVDVISTECCDHRRIVDPGNPGASYLLQKIRGG